LLLEKPLGADLKSAQSLINTISESFDETQVFRIDHYLAKETVQNILTFRFENPLFEAVWNRDHVSKIEIIASEKIGIEGRAAFYEGQGALRDFIQNHLLQLLAVATMDQPAELQADAIHASKLNLLQAIRPITSEDLTNKDSAVEARRGQYIGYRDEVGNAESLVETFASITTYIDTPRWQDVPITISTGKALANKQTSVIFTFDSNGARDTREETANKIEFRIAPNEGIAVHLLAKKPGFDHELQSVLMDFMYSQNFQGAQPNAYERVLLDAVRGDRTLFATSDEAIAAWKLVDPVVHAWQQNGDDLQFYQAGTLIDEL
jgi:glucose-6-phosphate 1-dehydrogenase